MKSSTSLFKCLALLLLALLAPAFQATAADAPLNATEQGILDKMRGSGQHRPFLMVDPLLVQVARAHAADMAKRHYFDHVNPDGHGPNWMVRNVGYPLPDWWGNDPKENYVESIACGQGSASATWSDWMNSPEHKTHLLATDSFYQDQTSVGIGYVSDPSSQYGTYWVVITAPPRPLPTLTVTSPATNLQTASTELALAGATGGTVPTASVIYRVENSAGLGTFVTASGTTSWTGTATGLLPGANIIRVRSLNAAGVAMVEVLRTVTVVIPASLTVNVSGSGTITAGYLGTTTRYLGMPYAIAATPGAGMIFAGWTGSTTASAPVIRFNMTEGYQLTANFVPNPFPAVRGSYLGLLSGSLAGRVGFTVAPNGAATCYVWVAGSTYSAVTALAADGTATVRIPRPGQTPLTLTVQVDLSGQSGVSGALTDGTVSSNFGTPAMWNATVACPYAGQYTVAMATDPNNDDPALQGVGYATLTIASNGHALLTGIMPNGRTFSSGTVISGGNAIPIYIPLGGLSSSLSGTLTLASTEVSDLQGSLHWVQQANPTGIHPAAIDATLPAVGSRYVRPQAGKTVVKVPTGPNNTQMEFGEGTLTQPVTQPSTLNPSNQLVLASPILPKLTAAINVASGYYRGSFVHPVTHAVTQFGGVVFQKQDAGYGMFVTPTASGYSSLTPAQ